METKQCGCRATSTAIYYCPTHAAAPDLLAAVDRLILAFGGDCAEYEPNCEICQAKALLDRVHGEAAPP